jgi:Fic family protein
VNGSLGDRLNELRKMSKMTLKQASISTGLDVSFISRIENNLRMPSDDQILIFSNIYKADYAALRKLATLDKVVALLAAEDDPEEMWLACEPRIEYLSRGKQSEDVFISNEIVGALQELDAMLDVYHKQEPIEGVRRSKMLDYFNVRYTFESNKIEGNTLTLPETSLVIKEGITISGKSMREHLEAINHAEAIALMYDLVSRSAPFNEYNLLQLHNIILRGIDSKNAGVFRNVAVRITGAEHIPPEPYLVPKLMEDYFLFYKRHLHTLHPVILAAEMHERLVTIHPFIDGNGRTSRLVMNLILTMHGYPIAILKGNQSDRLAYFNALQKVQKDHDSSDFHAIVLDALRRSLIEHIELTR